MTAGPRLLAIGGGGVTHGLDPALDAWLVARLRPGAAVGYLGLANGDAPERTARFLARYRALGAAPSALPMTATAAEAATWVAGLDALYLGGGSTARLLAALRDGAIGGPVVAAARAGLVLAGVSAGANVWFEMAFSDAGGTPWGPLPALGLLPGGLCPHADSEPGRLPLLAEAVAAGRMPATLALDDGAAVWLDGGGVQALSARPGAGVRRVAAGDGRALTRALELRALG